ncbi:SDR family NAD(P)-dependent oxidoreductase [Streptosporangium sp. NBC_01755]|uniref:SDR family NAD(P)-dependent oxidoreductase n=1 Tax=Streptosporangium sp. NBC_01755 TaxID=2975949 RepID=UPI002DD9955D|nr:SDR family NAD(P)-dependent oxidoreductase [Streptosporangium sp. NBC_01755]WSD00183.1 SDR family NAD(P)-dependent oxidoreductase [Streptosporangium sp. NBC_01755]
MNGVVFVFPGQGAQWRGMGSALLEQEPVFAAAIRECEIALEPYTDRSVTDVLAGRADADRIDVVQPALFALQIGLARLWAANGVVPAAVVGHSLGEIAAAHVAGALTLAEAARVVGVRSRLYRRLSGAGAMALVGLGWEETAALVAEQNGHRGAAPGIPGVPGGGGTGAGRICLAAANAPGSTVVAGDHDAVHALVEQLRWEDVFCRLVGADVAGHSHHVDPLLPELREELAALVPNRAGIPLWSTVTGRPGAVLDADYWCRNLREPVLFWPVIRQLLDAGYDTFVELSPHPTLLSGLRDVDARLLASVHKEDGAAFAGSLARLREVELTADGPLGDHRVEGRPVFPGAGYLAAALEHSGALAGVEFHAPLLLDAPRRLATRLDGDSIDLTVEGRTHASASRATPQTVAHLELSPLRSRCATRIAAEELYSGFTARGMRYGPAFQRIEEVCTAPGESLARLRAASPLSRARDGELASGPWPYRLDVALLDACLQAAAPILAEGDDLYLPRGVARVSVLGEVGAARWAHARVASATGPGDDIGDGGGDVGDRAGDRAGDRGGDRGGAGGGAGGGAHPEADAAPYQNAGTGDGAEVTLDIDACDEDGRVVLALRGVRLHRIARGAGTGGWTYSTCWVPVEMGADEPFGGVVHRVEPGRPAEEALRSLLDLTRELIAQPEPDRLWVVTRNAQPVEPGDPVDPDAAAVWGMARTIRHEHPELRCTLIDLDGEHEPSCWTPADLGAGGGSSSRIPGDTDAGNEWSSPDSADLGGGHEPSSRIPADAEDERPTWRLAGENEVALRGGRPFAPRLTPRPAGPRGPHRLVQRTRQDLATLSLAEDVPRAPGAGEVLIRVHAAGLNFNDVLRGIGMLGEQPEPFGYGLECAGEVTAVGDDVTGLAVGSRVVALVAEIGAMASHVTVDARLAVPIPGDLDFTAAATLPAAYVTVVYGMERLARLEAGERVLIHAAAGGVGQAAVRLARRAGAEVLATAGSPGKRAWLREQGVRHVFDSRSLDFADQVLEVTGGAGVDMVVNCLAGQAVDEGLRILAPFGRFVELGKRDIAENRPLPLAPFAKSLSFHAVEAFSLAGRRPALVGAMLREVVDAVGAGELGPLPVTAFPAAEAEAAFRHMASARHIGKVVLTFDRPRLRADGTYLVTGGLGGLGLAAAEGLVRQGARHLALLGRSEPGQAARERIAALREQGVRVVVLAADVADAGALERALDGLRAQAPPIRGVLHAAGVLRDRTIAAVDLDEVAEVLRPKVAGTRNLHRLTCDDPVELFVLFSSAAGLLGSGGQAGYAAANAFLDGFAHWRRRRGLPATSVDWGVWSQIGLAARPDRAGRLADRGMGSIDTASGLRILAELLAELPAQVAVVPLDAPTWFANNPGHEHWSIFAGLAAGHAGAGRLSITTPQELERALVEWVAGVLRTSPAAIDPKTSLTRLGLDSLMAVELRNLLEARLGVRLPAPAFLDGPTVTELAGRVSAHLDDRPVGEIDTRDPMAARLDALSDAQVDALLDELLNDHIGGMA